MNYMKMIFVVALAACLACNVIAGERGRLQRDLDGAENAVLSSLIVHANSKSRYLCAKTPYACAGPDRAELGLALLAASNQPEAPGRLARLVRYKFDAGLSSDFKCYAYARKSAVLKELKLLKPADLARQCNSEVAQFMARAKPGLYDITPESVCQTPGQVENEMEELSRVLRSSPGCDGF